MEVPMFVIQYYLVVGPIKCGGMLKSQPLLYWIDIPYNIIL